MIIFRILGKVTWNLKKTLKFQFHVRGYCYAVLDINMVEAFFFF